jgi:hypothetical protein
MFQTNIIGINETHISAQHPFPVSLMGFVIIKEKRTKFQQYCAIIIYIESVFTAVVEAPCMNKFHAILRQCKACLNEQRLEFTPVECLIKTTI